MSAERAIQLMKSEGAKFVDLKFTDLLGTWHHLTVPASEGGEELYEEGHGFDGSSIRAWQGINESDMLLMPDPDTARIDPFIKETTLSLICDVVDPITRQGYPRDPRGVAKRAENHLEATSIGDTFYVGPEAEFFVFDDVRFYQERHMAGYAIDSREGIWRSGTDGGGSNLAHRPRHKGGYFPVSPSDTMMDLRNEMCLVMESLGIAVETQHHEVATAGQGEIDLRFDSLLSMADKSQWFKYVVKNVALRNGQTATFMPKPLHEDNGNGMHTHMSIWKGGKPLFAGEGYGGMSEMGLHFIGGILKHAAALCAITNPTINSYRRLVPGYEAPNKLAYSCRNRSAAVRIPMYSANPKAKRIEFRTPDPSANPYLAFAACMMAGLDGVENQIHPGEPLETNIYNLPPEEAAKVRSAPGTLDDAVRALEEDHAFLLKGDVFSEDLVHAMVDWKRDEELKPARAVPTPFEFFMYYDV
jgi:glutamine synthetase